jgi:hypothetical protein
VIGPKRLTTPRSLMAVLASTTPKDRARPGSNRGG